jgi:prephenate dehydrogenase
MSDSVKVIPEMWTDIFINNKSNLNKSIIRIEKNISILKKLIFRI